MPGQGMEAAALILMFAALALASGLIAANRGRRRKQRRAVAGQVHRQHLYLFQGGHLGEAVVETHRRMFDQMLNRGDIREAERMIRTGTSFAAQIKALAEIGTDAAAVILERQLDRRHCRDPLEQSWYWLDVASALRFLGRSDCLPVLMHRAAERGLPLSHFLAAETVCFPGFMRHLEKPESINGRAAARTLIKALAGLRAGVQPHVVVVGRLGEAIETVWDHRREPVDPLAVRVLVESLRLLRRAEHAERLIGDNEAERHAFHAQIERIEERAEVFRDYLQEAVGELLEALPRAPQDEQAELLEALIELRADTAAVVMPLLQANRLADKGLAIESLASSTNPAVGPFLCRLIERELRSARGDFPIRMALRVLRHHPSEQAESLLLGACIGRKTEIRTAALGSLGWWEPVHREAVLACLREARYHGNPTILNAAQAALARLGERHALRWFRHQLVGEQSESVHRTIQRVAEEGILLLWPDVDALADADDRDIAFHACDALEQLREDCVLAAASR